MNEQQLGRKAYADVAMAVDDQWESGEGRATTFWHEGDAYCVLEDRFSVTVFSSGGDGAVTKTVLWIDHLPILREAMARVIENSSPVRKP